MRIKLDDHTLYPSRRRGPFTSVRGSDGAFDLDAISYFDPLTGLDADMLPTFIEELFEMARANDQLERIEQAYLGTDLYSRRRDLVERLRAPTEKRGGGAIDPRVLDLMEFADTCKDFGCVQGSTRIIPDRVAYIEWSMRKDPAKPLDLPAVRTDELAPSHQMTAMEALAKRS